MSVLHIPTGTPKARMEDPRLSFQSLDGGGRGGRAGEGGSVMSGVSVARFGIIARIIIVSGEWCHGD